VAALEFKLPDIGEGVHEAEIVQWHVAPGDEVAEDDPMVDVMTDKASVTIGAPRAGRIRELRFAVGDTAHVGQVLVVLDTDGGAETVEAGADGAEPAASEERAATAVGDIKATLPGTEAYPAERTTGRVPAAPPAPGDYFEAKPLATPATRKLARELSVDLRRVAPSRPDRRVSKEDVRAFAGGVAVGTAQDAAASPSDVASPAPPPPADERIPLVGLRRRIAERMGQVTRTAAMFTFVEECHVDRLLALRDRLAPQADDKGVRLTLLPFIVRAVVEALKHHPVLNSRLDEDAQELVVRRAYHIGVATATEAGLMVPVLRDADRRSILDIAREVERLAEGARQGTLGRDELTGSTFTVTSLGKLGGLFATPILNPPESAILGVHRIRERPVVRDGNIEVGKVMLLSLTFDHRVVDGHVGAAFAYDVIAYLEEPDRLFLEMA
jgi:pyruvate dehydrogenase E2 component (dihydrolipoamide acetyltransferase)